MHFIDSASDILSDIAPNGFAAGLGNFTTGNVAVHTNYRADWQHLYQKKGWVERDPIVFAGIRCTGITDWPDPAQTQNEVIRRAADFGLSGGITVSNSVGGHKCIVGLASEKPLSQAARQTAFSTIQETHIQHLITQAEGLSEAQKDVVALFANGFRAKQVAEFFQISEDAVKQRKAAVQRHLGVTNFLVAVNICAMAGLTKPRAQA